MSVNIPPELDEYISDYSVFSTLQTPAILDGCGVTFCIRSADDPSYHYLMSQPESISATVLESQTDAPVEQPGACFELISAPDNNYYIRDYAAQNASPKYYWHYNDSSPNDPMVQRVGVSDNSSLETDPRFAFALTNPNLFQAPDGKRIKYLTLRIAPVTANGAYLSVDVNRVQGLTLSNDMNPPFDWIIRFKYLPKLLYTAILTDPMFGRLCCRDDATVILSKYPNFLEACRDKLYVRGNEVCKKFASKFSFKKYGWIIGLVVGIIVLLGLGFFIYRSRSKS